jgi:hypothetical protein
MGAALSNLESTSGMSKRKSYGKIYHPDVRVRPRTDFTVRAGKNLSVRTQPSVRADAFPPLAPPSPRPSLPSSLPPLVPPSPRPSLPSSLPYGRSLLSLWTRMRPLKGKN